jgi:hypothetical protein
VRFSGRLEQPDWKGLWVRVGNDNRTALWDEAGFFYRDFNLDEGENTAVLFAVDIAGNKETLVFNIIVDTRPPNVRYFSPKMSPNLEAKVQDDTVVISGVVEEEGVTLLINSRPIAVVPKTGTFQTTVPLSLGLNNIEISYSDRAGNSGSDILKITYEKSNAKANPTMSALGSLWWLFAIAIAVLIVLPITVNMTRSRWVKQHPELENFDPKAAREAYAEEEPYDDPFARRGGGL